jgi:7-cyano-7-deazaguanine synthase
MKKAVVLLSGGLDSSTVLYWAIDKGYDCSCLLFDYGQRHKKELKGAAKIASLAGCTYKIVKISLPWATGSLTDKAQKIPHNNKLLTSVHGQSSLPSTYVPGRNTIFISYAVSYAESIGAKTIFIGANAVDYSGYPDCRPRYYGAFDRLLQTLPGKIEIKTPLLKLSKDGIVKLACKLKVPLKHTWSCYGGGNVPCGVCDSCLFRAKGFNLAKIEDPASL